MKAGDEPLFPEIFSDILVWLERGTALASSLAAPLHDTDTRVARTSRAVMKEGDMLMSEREVAGVGEQEHEHEQKEETGVRTRRSLLRKKRT